MPLYEYNCTECGKVSELLVNSDTKIACEHCGSKMVEKMFSTFSAQVDANKNVAPPCAGGCGGFEGGACGSGMCGM